MTDTVYSTGGHRIENPIRGIAAKNVLSVATSAPKINF